MAGCAKRSGEWEGAQQHANKAQRVLKRSHPGAGRYVYSATKYRNVSNDAVLVRSEETEESKRKGEKML